MKPKDVGHLASMEETSVWLLGYASQLMKRTIVIVSAIAVVAVLIWLGRRHYNCERRSSAFNRQIESIKVEAHERLKPGTKKADIKRFFVERNIPFFIYENEFRGTLQSSGCAPFGCGTDAAIIGVSVQPFATLRFSTPSAFSPSESVKRGPGAIRGVAFRGPWLMQRSTHPWVLVHLPGTSQSLRTQVRRELLHLHVLGFGLLQDGGVGVGVSTCRRKILVGG
jgi:hypothetical protein